MDRRRFLESSAAAGLWLAAAGCARSAAREADDAGGAAADTDAAPDTDGAGGTDAAGGASAAGRISSWGVQLYTVRSLMARDVEGTLAAVADIGYREVEFAGYFERSPAQIRATLDAEGLAAPAVHLPIGVFREGLESALEAAEVIGHRHLVLPYLDQADRGGADDYRRLAEEMNGFGERCRTAGARFAYHNHDFELERVDGEIPLELLLAGTDPELVSFELDFFWLVNGGGDPFDYFERHPGRFRLCHVKDRTPSGDMVSVGEGAIDFAAIFARSEQAGLEHYFVEHDNPPDPLASIRASYDHLAALSA